MSVYKLINVSCFITSCKLLIYRVNNVDLDWTDCVSYVSLMTEPQPAVILMGQYTERSMFEHNSLESGVVNSHNWSCVMALYACKVHGLKIDNHTVHLSMRFWPWKTYFNLLIYRFYNVIVCFELKSSWSHVILTSFPGDNDLWGKYIYAPFVLFCCRER